MPKVAVSKSFRIPQIQRPQFFRFTLPHPLPHTRWSPKPNSRWNYLTAQKGNLAAARRLSRLSLLCGTFCLSSGERLSSSSDESPSPYATNEAMADDLTAEASSVFGFFVTAAGCVNGPASRLPASKINTHHNTTGKDKWNTENKGKESS